MSEQKIERIYQKELIEYKESLRAVIIPFLVIISIGAVISFIGLFIWEWIMIGILILGVGVITLLCVLSMGHLKPSKEEIKTRLKKFEEKTYNKKQKELNRRLTHIEMQKAQRKYKEKKEREVIEQEKKRKEEWINFKSMVVKALKEDIKEPMKNLDKIFNTWKNEVKSE